ncbi:MAG: DUF3179 domain-containing (seleno)protein, partial [Thermoanaerobaculia bacterium]
WVANHPETLVLSVDGVEHEERNPYQEYFANDEGFRGLAGADDRLATKEPIYSFQLAGSAYAVPHSAFEDGAAFDLGEHQVFLFRPPEVSVFYSTLAWVSSAGSFEKRDDVWSETASGAAFDDASSRFTGDEGGRAPVERLDGFDTYWYSWSLIHPQTEVLNQSESVCRQ